MPLPVDKLPALLAWVDELLARHAAAARPVSAYAAQHQFARLTGFFPQRLLDRARVVEMPSPPAPPLSRLGIPGFDEMERPGGVSGITFKDTYFIRTGLGGAESLHFHELVHVVQWRYLGPERFLAAYAAGYLSAGGYRGNPLEQMAYDLQSRFDADAPPFDAPLEVTRRLDVVMPKLMPDLIQNLPPRLG